MKLTNKDKNYLLSIGYLTEDLNEIEISTRRMRYELFFVPDDSKPTIQMTQKQVIKILGRETFLRGIARATFHRTAVRSTESIPNVAIYFKKKEI